MTAREPGFGAGSGDAAMSVRPGATALLAGAISYALGACADVAPEEMSLPTPCTQWDLKMLLSHLQASMADLEAAIGTGQLGLEAAIGTGQLGLEAAIGTGQLGLEAAIGTGQLGQEARHRPDPVPEDPVEVLRNRAASLLWASYEACGHGRFVLVDGLPLSAGIVACTGAVEIAVHGWDVSAARGRGGPIPPGLATRMLSLCPLLVAVREGLFAEPAETSPGASPCDRLVAYLGRVPKPPRN